MILGFRNPFLTPEFIDKASVKFKHSKAQALISVKNSIDHPCQLNSYYKIVDIGLIHLFDEERHIAPYLKLLSNHTSTKFSSNQRNPNNLRSNLRYPNQRNQCNPSNQRYHVTKPFHFDWESRGIHEKGKSGLYFRGYDDYHIKYIPIDDSLDNNSPEISSPLWIYDTGNTARILLDLTNYPSPEEPIKTDPNFRVPGK